MCKQSLSLTLYLHQTKRQTETGNLCGKLQLLNEIFSEVMRISKEKRKEM